MPMLCQYVFSEVCPSSVKGIKKTLLDGDKIDVNRIVANEEADIFVVSMFEVIIE